MPAGPLLPEKRAGGMRRTCGKEGTDHENGTCNCYRSVAAAFYGESLLELRHANSLCEHARRGDVDAVRSYAGRSKSNVDFCEICGKPPEEPSRSPLRLLTPLSARPSRAGYAPLLYACKNGREEVCRILLDDLGACLWVKTRSLGANCLHRAAMGGHVGIVKLLLARDRDGRLASEPDADGNLPLHKAAGAEVREALLEAYPPAAGIRNKRGELPPR